MRAAAEERRELRLHLSLFVRGKVFFFLPLRRNFCVSGAPPVGGCGGGSVTLPIIVVSHSKREKLARSWHLPPLPPPPPAVVYLRVLIMFFLCSSPSFLLQGLEHADRQLRQRDGRRLEDVAHTQPAPAHAQPGLPRGETCRQTDGVLTCDGQERRITAVWRQASDFEAFLASYGI